MRREGLDIVVIRGAPGAGKSLTAKCLAEYFPGGARIEVDNLRSMVISVDWTNQCEHTNMLRMSTRLVCDFVRLGYRPVIVVDTFSGGKIVKFLDGLHELEGDLSIRTFGLYATEEELRRRIQSRQEGEFRDYGICQRLNDEVRNTRYDGEVQLNTTGLEPQETAMAIFDHLNSAPGVEESLPQCDP